MIRGLGRVSIVNNSRRISAIMGGACRCHVAAATNSCYRVALGALLSRARCRFLMLSLVKKKKKAFRPAKTRLLSATHRHASILQLRDINQSRARLQLYTVNHILDVTQVFLLIAYFWTVDAESKYRRTIKIIILENMK